ncbi:hypothetical protein K439DRAFT_1332481 [Ramaria rubella]|nr:hypothetical protein K439DRAFT_1332481 [Ramaria rubella]
MYSILSQDVFTITPSPALTHSSLQLPPTSIGPVSQSHENSKYYSAVRPVPNRAVDESLPHITIQMPVYKESLEQTITPSVESLKKAMQTYARQGGTSTIFINDDGMQAPFYAQHGIGWAARPKHDPTGSGFVRAGRFKK